MNRFAVRFISPFRELGGSWRGCTVLSTMFVFALGHSAEVLAQGIRIVSTSLTQNGGTFTVNPAGTLEVGGATDPLLTLTGGATTSGIEELWVGGGGGERGRILVTGGSTLTNSGYAVLGGNPTWRGIVTVNNAQWQNGDLVVGQYGTGILNIETNGYVSTASATLGYYSSGNGGKGTVNVSGANAQWYNNAFVNVGFGGSGTLNVSSGGYVYGGDYGTAIGYDSLGSGTASVTGGGTTLNTGTYLTVGAQGSGVLNIDNGGTIISSLSAVGGDYQGFWGPPASSGGTGTVNVRGAGSIWYTGATEVGLNGTGTLVVENGGVINLYGGGSLLLGSQGTLTGNGGTVKGNVVSDGIIAPGASPGILSIDGDLSVSSLGQLQLEIGGTTPAAFDQLFVTGDLSLAGLVSLSFVNGYVPHVGDSFDLFHVSGTFSAAQATFNWVNLPAGLQYQTSFADGVFSAQIATVPEPSTLLLMLTGLCATAVTMRRAKAQGQRHCVNRVAKACGALIQFK